MGTFCSEKQVDFCVEEGGYLSMLASLSDRNSKLAHQICYI
jgi:hypothetical protein